MAQGEAPASNGECGTNGTDGSQQRRPQRRTGRRTRRRTMLTIALALLLCVAVAFGAIAVLIPRLRHDSLPEESVTGGIHAVAPASVLHSSVDYDHDGIDDYSDILQGARMDAKARLVYDASYYQGGYPPDNRGACTDVVWRAFKNAGYDLKNMVDADIAADPTSYGNAITRPDPNIDFRRTGVLDVFFSKYGQHLTTDIADHDAWQQGDIVIFENVKHIGIISDLRDGQGVPLVLHNMGQHDRENDYLAFRKHMQVTGHYRFDASKIPASVLKPWHAG
ncbi:MAG: DUF1287 domain-containing protein [Bifidobacterium sp.]|uniref:DUF1287 domain-containing protein n=1 Tax=Bifidobacterium sp. TaxID=41200 RepID=UPI0039EA9FAA